MKANQAAERERPVPLPMARKCAVGLIRVSEVGEREGESFASPQDQRAAIERICAQHDWSLDPAHVFEELDVSAYRRSFAERPGLLEVVRLLEDGQAQVVVVAYFDRLFRQLDVQRQVLTRIEAAGGEVFTADIGSVSQRGATRKLTSTMLGAIAEYFAELTAEKTLAAKARAVARGVAPFPNLIAGYRRNADTGAVEVDPLQAPLVKHAFKMRADGATIREVRDFLRAHDLPLDYQRTRTMLASRFVLGELRHGAFENLESHEPLVDEELFELVQHQKADTRGRRPKSERVLARLGVLRCGTCNRPLSVGAWFNKRTGERVATYGCAQPDAACPAQGRINAEPLEKFVIEHLRERLRGDTGHATVATKIRQLEVELAERQSELARAIETLAGFDDIAATRERLEKLRAAVTEVEVQLAALPVRLGAVRRLPASAEWSTLLPAEQRDLLRLHIERITVAAGRGAGRVTVEFFSE